MTSGCAQGTIRETKDSNLGQLYARQTPYSLSYLSDLALITFYVFFLNDNLLGLEYRNITYLA